MSLPSAFVYSVNGQYIVPSSNHFQNNGGLLVDVKLPDYKLRSFLLLLSLLSFADLIPFRMPKV